MCIRDRSDRYLVEVSRADGLDVVFVSYLERAVVDRAYITNCLLYTSDAADERSSVDLGGRRIIKKKTKTTYKQ